MSARKKAKKIDLSPPGLDQIPDFDKKIIQPSWVSKECPDLIKHDHTKHGLSSVRTTTHNGHEIKITTKYEIKVDGRPLYFHALVGNDGRLKCHATPYTTYGSAIELIKTLMDRFPEALEDSLKKVRKGHKGGGK